VTLPVVEKLPAVEKLRIAFAGTPAFASSALRRLVDARFDVPLVLTQPDRPAGRGLKLHASPVKQLAQQHHVTVVQPRSLKLDGKFADDAAAVRATLEAARPDVIVVAAYGLILPPWVLALPRLGCLNIHASLLPRRSIALSKPATRRPASPSCRWMRAWTPATCCSSNRCRLPLTRPRRRCTTSWQRSAVG
jgi:Formyl transferase